MGTGIKSTFARDAYISSTCTVSTWIRYAGIRSVYTGGICIRSAFIKGVEPRVLAGLRITLAGLGINNCCFGLFMELIFALIERVCY